METMDKDQKVLHDKEVFEKAMLTPSDRVSRTILALVDGFDLCISENPNKALADVFTIYLKEPKKILLYMKTFTEAEDVLEGYGESISDAIGQDVIIKGVKGGLTFEAYMYEGGQPGMTWEKHTDLLEKFLGKLSTREERVVFIGRFIQRYDDYIMNFINHQNKEEEKNKSNVINIVTKEYVN